MELPRADLQAVLRHEAGAGGIACPQCGAVFIGARWKWPATAPARVAEQPCPACRRIRDHVPAGRLALRGEFVAAHRGEVLAEVHHSAAEQAAEYPLRRVIEIVERPDGFDVLVTDRQLPEAIGRRLHEAFGGELHDDAADGSGDTSLRWNL